MKGSGPDSFGNMATMTGNESSRNPFRFSTKYTDDETDLVYYGYRYLSTEMGTWLNRDPIGERGGKGLYRFVRNSPLTNTDPHGLTSDSSDEKFLEWLVGEGQTACCKRADLLEALRPWIKELRVLSSKTRKIGPDNMRCLTDIRCGRCSYNWMDASYQPPSSCYKYTSRGYRKVSCHGQIRVCGKPTQNSLRHELQHAQQCGDRPSCFGSDPSPIQAG